MKIEDLPVKIGTNFSLLEENLQEVHHSEYYNMYKYKLINTHELDFFECEIKSAFFYFNAKILIGVEIYFEIVQTDKFLKEILPEQTNLLELVDCYSLGFSDILKNIDGVDIVLSYDEEKEVFYLEYNKYERWFGGVFSMDKFEN